MGTVKRSWKLQEFVAHRANVNCLAMGHKSNQVLATGGDDKKVNLWAIGRHSCLMSLSGHTTPVECVCFGHSEDLVCAGSQTGALKIWDLEAAKLLRTFTGHKGAIKCMDFHPYGDYLTSGSCDNNIKLWDTRKRGCIVTYASHRRAVNSLQFSPDGQWIASACEDGIVKVWDVRVGKVLKEFDDHTAAVTCIKFHPHEFLLASCSVDRSVNFWDMEKFQLVSKHQKESSPTRHLLFSNDGMSLLGGGHDGLQVIGWEPTRILDTVSSTWGQIHDMTVAHNQLIAGSFHSTYVVMSVVDLNKVHPFGGPPPVATPVARDTSPFQKGQSVRKSFSKERPAKEVLHNKSVLDDKTVEESTSGTEADEESAAVIPNFSDYQEIFRPSRAYVISDLSANTPEDESKSVRRPRSMTQNLNRTPPPSTSYLSESDTEDVKDLPPSSQCTRSLRDLSLADLDSQPTSAPSSLPNDPSTSRPAPIPLQKQKTDLFYSRIPTSTKENHNNVSIAEKSKSDIFVRSMDSISTADDSTYVTPHISGRRQSPSRSHMPQQILNRQHSYKENSRNNNNINNYYNSRKLRSSHSEVSLGPPSLGGRSLSFSNSLNEPARVPKTSPAPERRPTRTASPGFEAYDRAPTGIKAPRERATDTDFVPIATDKPVGLDLDDFLPKANVGGGRLGGMVPEQSEQEVFGIMMRGHDSMMAVLSGRQRSLQIFHSVRTNKNLRSALESTIALDDVAVIVDILNVMAHKPSLWNLDICLLLLPKIHELLQSKYESYMTCGCNSLRLILRNFSSVIKSNVNSPVRSLGVDIPREERYSKCLQIHDVLLDIRAFLLKRQTMQGRLGATFRDLHNLIQQGLE